MDNIGFKENLTCEFKSCVNGLEKDKVVDAIVAMANTQGGTVYIGVENNGEISGLTKYFTNVIEMRAYISNKTVPSLYTNAELLDKYGKTIMAITVRKSFSLEATAGGKILRRRIKADGTPENVPIYPYEIPSRLSDLGRLDFSAQILPKATTEDFDPLQIEKLRAHIRTFTGGDKTLLELDDEEMEKALHFVVDDNGELIPTVTGLLMIGRQEAIANYLPTAKATFQVLEGTEVRVNIEKVATILELLEDFDKYFNAWNPEREFQYGLFRMPVPEFSYGAYREAIVNAFCHRDYTILARVRVMIDDTQMEITSPGSFIDGITLENLLTAEPRGRNLMLAETFKRIGLAERTGRGIDKIFGETITYGRPWPDYSESNDQRVKVSLLRSNPDMGFLKMLTDYNQSGKKPLSVYALMVLSCLKNYKRCSEVELENCCHLRRERVKILLANLVEEGLVERVAHGKNWDYMLNLQVYRNNDAAIKNVRQRGINEVRYSAMIIELASKQNGMITNADIRELLKIDHNMAYSLIKKLQKSGVLQLIQSGKYAKYKLKSEKVNA